MAITWTMAFFLLLIGLGVGTVSGMIGIGGGILVIPILMFFFGFSQAKANGTSLAMLLPPIGIFAVLTYSRVGNINWMFAMLLAGGFALGAYFGALIVNRGLIHPTTLRIAFALFLIYVAGNMLFSRGGSARAALMTSLMVAGFALTYVIARLLSRRYLSMPSWGDIYRNRVKDGMPYDYEI